MPPAGKAFDDYRKDAIALREIRAFRAELEEIANAPDPQEAAKQAKEALRQRQLQAGKDAREFSRLQSAVYNAKSKEEREAARKTFDDYRKREAHKYEVDDGQKRRRTRRRSMRP